MYKLIPLALVPLFACSTETPSLSGDQAFPVNSQYAFQPAAQGALVIEVGEAETAQSSCVDGGFPFTKFVGITAFGADGGPVTTGSYPLAMNVVTGGAQLGLATYSTSENRIAYSAAAVSGHIDITEVDSTSVHGSFSADLIAFVNGRFDPDAGLGTLTGTFDAPMCASPLP
jgi:hypothetical protein